MAGVAAPKGRRWFWKMGFRFHSSDCSSETNGESHGQKERPSQKKTGRPTEAMSSAPDLTFRLTDSTGAGHGEEAQTFRFSSMTYAERSSTLDADRESTISASDRVSAPGAVGRGTFARGSLVDRDIEAIAVSKPKGERARDYKGRYRVRLLRLPKEETTKTTDLFLS